METRFTLSQTSDKALPETVEVNGSAFSVNTCFRNVLRILRMLQDDDVVEKHRPGLLCKWFFVDVAPGDIEAALNAFMQFLHRGNQPHNVDTSKPPSFDYEMDAPEIYASFFALYGIDLLGSEMHWWRFCALLDGAFRTDCALSDKVRLRKIDASKCENPDEVSRAQEEIRIERKVSRAERDLQQRLYEVLTGGGDVSAALEALKDEL